MTDKIIIDEAKAKALEELGVKVELVYAVDRKLAELIGGLVGGKPARNTKAKASRGYKPRKQPRATVYEFRRAEPKTDMIPGSHRHKAVLCMDRRGVKRGDVVTRGLLYSIFESEFGSDVKLSDVVTSLLAAGELVPTDE